MNSNNPSNEKACSKSYPRPKSRLWRTSRRLSNPHRRIHLHPVMRPRTPEIHKRKIPCRLRGAVWRNAVDSRQHQHEVTLVNTPTIPIVPQQRRQMLDFLNLLAPIIAKESRVAPAAAIITTRPFRPTKMVVLCLLADVFVCHG